MWSIGVWVLWVGGFVDFRLFVVMGERLSRHSDIWGGG